MSENGERIMHFQWRIKCLNCSLHFIVLSEDEEWVEGRPVFCPECGSEDSGGGGHFIYWKPVPSTRFIYEIVPGGETEIYATT